MPSAKNECRGIDGDGVDAVAVPAGLSGNECAHPG